MALPTSDNALVVWYADYLSWRGYWEAIEPNIYSDELEIAFITSLDSRDSPPISPPVSDSEADDNTDSALSGTPSISILSDTLKTDCNTAFPTKD